MAKIIHKYNNCIGCSYCIDLAPQYYAMNINEGKVKLIGAKQKGVIMVLSIPDFEIELFKSIIDICPADVIKIEK